MTSTGSDHIPALLQLTKTAVEAAQSGRWDLVSQCYLDRGILLETMGVTADRSEELLALDRLVRDQVQATQALLTSLLGDAAATKRRVQELRQRLGVLTSTSDGISVEA